MTTIRDILDIWVSEQDTEDTLDLDKLMRILRNTYLTGFLEGSMVGGMGLPLPSPDEAWADFEGRDLSEPGSSVVMPPKPKLVI